MTRTFPPVVILNGHTPRTAQLLGEAYERNDPLIWKRGQYVADLRAVSTCACDHGGETVTWVL